MTDLQNPIFEDEKEQLERQRLEYKNALLNDVNTLKDQTSQMSKGVLVLGGALAGVWIVSKIISGGKKRKKNKKKKAAKKRLQQQKQANIYLPYSSQYAPNPVFNEDVNFGSPLDFNQVTEEAETEVYNNQAYNPAAAGRSNQYALHYHAASQEQQTRSFLESDLVKSVATQVLAFALVYLTKKAEEYLAKNHDIATEKGFNTRDVDFTDLNTDAGKHL